MRSTPSLLPTLALTLALALPTGCGDDGGAGARAAVDLLQAGKTTEALPLLEEAARARPDDGTLQFYLASAQRAAGRGSDAAATLQRLVETSPKDGAAHALLGTVLRESGDAEGALRHGGLATSLRGDDGAAWNDYGLTLAAAGKLQEAVGAYDRARTLMPQDPAPSYNLGELYRRLNQLPASEGALERAAELAPGNCRVLFALAEVQFALGRWAEARRRYGAIVALAPPELRDRRARVLFQLARTYFEGNHLDSAEKTLELAEAEGYPRDAVALWKGRVRYARGDYRQALETLQAIPATAWPDLPEVAYYVGLSQYALGLYREALESFQGALQSRLPQGPLFSRMGLTYLKLYDGVDALSRAERARALLEKARELFARSLAADPANLEAQLGAARVDFKAGRAPAALAAARGILALRPSHPPALLLAGLCLYETGTLDEAAAHIKRYVELQPGEARVVLFLAQIYAELSLFPEAVAFFEQGIKTRPRDWDARLMLSSVYSRQGSYLAAADELLEVLRTAEDPKVLDEARRMYELITRPFRTLLFPEPAVEEPSPVVPGSREDIDAKLTPARRLRDDILAGTAGPTAVAELQDRLRSLIVEYNRLKRQRLFLSEDDRRQFRTEIRALIDFTKGVR